MGTHPIFESDFDCLTEKMERCVESLLPLDLLEEMEMDTSNSSPRSSASQWSTTSDFSDVGGQHQNQQNMVTLLPASMWAHKIMPLCLAKAAQIPDDRLNQRTLAERAFVSIFDETLIMCKMRELNVGDGFPRGELAATYNPERIAAINAISTVIDSCIGQNPPRKLTVPKVTPPPPAVAAAATSSNEPSNAASLLVVREQISTYLCSSRATILSCAKKRGMLECIFAGSFPSIFPAAGSSYPTSLLPLESLVAQAEEITSLIDFELTALEIFFNKIGNLAQTKKLTFMGANTSHLVQWFIEKLVKLKTVNSRLIRKLKTAQRHVNVDQMMMIPAFRQDFVDHNEKIELLQKELISYGNILITELSSYLEFQSTQN